MGNDVLHRVEQLANNEGQPKADNNFLYEWEPSNIMENLDTQEINKKEEEKLEEPVPLK